LADAAKELSEAVRLKPDYLEAVIDLGRAFAAQHKFKEAEGAFQHALQLAPTNATLHVHLGTALLMGNETNEAGLEFAKAIELQPDLADKYVAEGKSLVTRGELNAALVRFNTAVRLQQDSPNPLSSLAWLLATHPQPQMRDGRRALTLARHAVEVAASDAHCWAALDVAQAENGEFQQAIQAAEKSRDLALAAGDSQTAQAADGRIALYRERQPYHLR
jgi:Flp pilus assembly protein TadD